MNTNTFHFCEVMIFSEIAEMKWNESGNFFELVFVIILVAHKHVLESSCRSVLTFIDNMAKSPVTSHQYFCYKIMYIFPCISKLLQSNRLCNTWGNQWRQFSDLYIGHSVSFKILAFDIKFADESCGEVILLLIYFRALEMKIPDKIEQIFKTKEALIQAPCSLTFLWLKYGKCGVLWIMNLPNFCA